MWYLSDINYSDKTHIDLNEVTHFFKKMNISIANEKVASTINSFDKVDYQSQSGSCCQCDNQISTKF